ncbi:hypothetical protein AB0F18_22525 [Streptomyces sp. NPDC029216]|uniref:hypothetical protein n=1 Tax=Streptomyces sp. NPDC029216 TaxID=3154701 RepID=UPI0033C11C3C
MTLRHAPPLRSARAPFAATGAPLYDRAARARPGPVAVTGGSARETGLPAAPFTQVFGRLLPVTDHHLYVVCVVLGGSATGALTAPMCLNRLVLLLGTVWPWPC